MPWSTRLSEWVLTISHRRHAMQNKYAEVTPRNFNPMWCEKNSEQVIEQMAAAARALGWPEQIIDTIRAQMQSITKMQIQTMDQMMDAWEEQIKSPNPTAMLSKLKSLPGISPTGSWPNASALARPAISALTAASAALTASAASFSLVTRSARCCF